MTEFLLVIAPYVIPALLLLILIGIGWLFRIKSIINTFKL